MKYPTAVTVIYLDGTNQYVRAEVTEVAQAIRDAVPYQLKIQRFDLVTEDQARRVARLALKRPDLFVAEPPV